MKNNSSERERMPKLTKEEILAEFTHYALMFGVVPVYYNVNSHTYCVRNECPRAYSELVINVVALFWLPARLISPSCQPAFWFRLGARIR